MNAPLAAPPSRKRNSPRALEEVTLEEVHLLPKMIDLQEGDSKERFRLLSKEQFVASISVDTAKLASINVPILANRPPLKYRILLLSST